MTGPLTRLVGRSRSPVPGLRPRPVSRYERSSPADGPPPPARPDAPEPPARQAAAIDGTDPSVEEEGPRAPLPTGTTDAEPAVPGREPPTRALSVVRHPAVRREDVSVVRERPSALRQDVPVRREEPAPLPHPVPAEATQEPGRPADPRRSFLQSPEQETPEPPGHHAPHAVVAFDRPLLHAEAPPPLVAGAPAAASATAAEPAVVVEVSIGRLDVRAPAPPAPPQPPVPRRDAQADHAKALQNYLRRRAEGELG
ncbi:MULTISPECIES: hypothetical protein [Streptomyces]|uniref:hypothetical protein n=1 Tax=Streptomyces herbicida TaxID=3065675 RepID=UPI00292E9F18|nr:hypothetical protein [Streptomyces sp. NEAU-HV9]